MGLHVLWRESENYAPWRGAYSAPAAISALRNAINTKFGGWVELGPHKNYLWCKFGEPSSTSSRSNDVFSAKFSRTGARPAAVKGAVWWAERGRPNATFTQEACILIAFRRSTSDGRGDAVHHPYARAGQGSTTAFHKKVFSGGQRFLASSIRKNKYAYKMSK